MEVVQQLLKLPTCRIANLRGGVAPHGGIRHMLDVGNHSILEVL